MARSFFLISAIKGVPSLNAVLGPEFRSTSKSTRTLAWRFHAPVDVGTASVPQATTH
jgi:hypothetical protein